MKVNVRERGARESRREGEQGRIKTGAGEKRVRKRGRKEREAGKKGQGPEEKLVVKQR